MSERKPQADRHDSPPLSFRPDRDLRAWLLAFAKRTGLSRNAIVSAALSEYRSAHSPSQETRDEDR